MTETKIVPANSEKSGFDSLDMEKVIERNENSVTLEFSISGANPYYDGHFPGFPILPAVAQTELVLRFASRYLGTGIDVSEIRRIKFMNLVRPFIPLVLKLEKNEKNLSFRMSSPNGETVYSTGTLEMKLNSVRCEGSSPKETDSLKKNP